MKQVITVGSKNHYVVKSGFLAQPLTSFQLFENRNDGLGIKCLGKYWLSVYHPNDSQCIVAANEGRAIRCD